MVIENPRKSPIPTPVVTSASENPRVYRTETMYQKVISHGSDIVLHPIYAHENREIDANLIISLFSIPLFPVDTYSSIHVAIGFGNCGNDGCISDDIGVGCSEDGVGEGDTYTYAPCV